MKSQIPSIIRWALALFGSYLSTKSLGDFEAVKQLDLTDGAFIELISGLLVILLSLALKKADEVGLNGKLARLFVGPKVQNIADSIARWLVTIIAGSSMAIIGMNAEQLAGASLATIVAAFISFAIDRIWKKAKP